MEDRTYRCINTIRNQNRERERERCVCECDCAASLAFVVGDGCVHVCMCVSLFAFRSLYSIRHKYRRVFYCCYLFWSKTLVDCFVSGKYTHKHKWTMPVRGRMYTFLLLTRYIHLYIWAFVYRSFKKRPLCLSYVRFGFLSFSLPLLSTHRTAVCTYDYYFDSTNYFKWICEWRKKVHLFSNQHYRLIFGLFG